MPQIDDLPPLRDVIATHGLDARKSLGQNFLLDLNLTARIARSSGALEGVTVVEVGPGPGGLTRGLLAEGAKAVIAIEKDRRCLAALREIADHYPGRLTIIEGDALEIDMAALAAGVDGPVKVVANLPYNVGTQLLTGWLECDPWPPWWQSLTLMFQKEVAERIVASEVDKAYGRLGVLAGWRTRARMLFDIAPQAFTPPPKVTSAVVHLEPILEPMDCDIRYLRRVTAAAFGQRRKMLRSSLKALNVAPAALLDDAGLNETARAEEIPVSGFVALANSLRERSNKAQ
ncbi:16S rRNA (adenine(1518)-N(6)/adenine(1519)-N(6))-dimethyltransferase RsmA [Breoghania sp. L-A4]|uniref:16S rRNA (adenine(1518)-N(6)/adenine(1519)-N(6))- dimethyltransferase RsmA n=1 Tax=Breoghania sp. L-A4 TaxID=2304600 RepID=UPI000E35DA42|nr:16S rRNA (adenine(1518)-N(6)/adenine(1519)-N(6))-dimethyltransferase RsmA [Breoghania sp. L-A4]AXS40601.1 16S rRNA (adenine(1518)-N(6)/adenine(1519)-N(6))-dimethyltransferase RsmA [Breoghania sp. L-A4]